MPDTTPTTLELRLDDEQTRMRRSSGARRGWATRKYRARRRLEQAIVKVVSAWHEYDDDPRTLDPLHGAIGELEQAWQQRAGARLS